MVMMGGNIKLPWNLENFHSLGNYEKEDPKLSLILATVALGIGVNAKALCELFPVDKPTTLQNWKGRAARTTINNNEDRKGVTEGTGNTAQPEHV